MSIDGLTTVEGIADFLDAEIVNAVPGELRSEVRAAAKLLRTSAVELSVRYREVGAEIDDLLVLCAAHAAAEDAARVIDLSARAAGERLSLREQERLRTDVHDLVSRTMQRLTLSSTLSSPVSRTVSNEPGLAEFLRCLGGHAARRSTWQAVFPGNPAGVSA